MKNGAIMIDELWPGGPLFESGDGVYKVGTDSALLADFVVRKSRKRTKRVMDLGCGSGIITVLLAVNLPELLIDGVDISSVAVDCATKNAELAGITERVNNIKDDLRNFRDLWKPESYDLVVSNPPYYTPESGYISPDAKRASARSEQQCTLDDVCAAAGYLTKWGGSFALVHKPERLADVFRSLEKYKLEPKRLRFVQNMSDSPPSLVLIESRKGGNPSLIIEAPLILRNDDGSESDELKQAHGVNN